MKKHSVSKIFVSVAPDGKIRAKVYRGHSRVEPLLFDTVQDLLEWPEISERTPVRFQSKGLVPNLILPCEPIFYFCSPEEIKEFISMTNAGNRVGWLEKYTELIKALQAEHFDIGSVTGGRVDLTDLISNPKGYTVEQMIRCYEDGYFI